MFRTILTQGPCFTVVSLSLSRALSLSLSARDRDTEGPQPRTTCNSFHREDQFTPQAVEAKPGRRLAVV
uniref:Putative secreted protein n=1 Tax=Anopheles marajoara TaxID=58244 RepID=A0A2M4CEX3_9DIPT